MAITYPSTLPRPTKAAHLPKRRVRESDLPGVSSFSSRERDFSGTMEVAFFFTLDQAAQFYAWWGTTLKQGGMWFNCSWPSIRPGNMVCQFLTEPVMDHVYMGAHRVSATVQVRGASLPVLDAFSDPYFGEVSLLLHADEAEGSDVFTDSSDFNHSCTPQNGLVITTSNPRFGQGSILSSGIGGAQLNVTSSTAFDMGSGNFTAECFAALASVSGLSRGLFGRGSNMYATTMGFYLFVESSDVRARVSNGSTYLTLVGSTAFGSVGTYAHIALVRLGDLFTLYANGAEMTSGSLGGSLPVNSEPVFVCGNPSENGIFGLIDEVRLTKGIARYTGPTYDIPVHPFADR